MKKYFVNLSKRLFYMSKILIGIILYILIHIGLYLPLLIVYPIIWIFTGIQLTTITDYCECKFENHLWDKLF